MATAKRSSTRSTRTSATPATPAVDLAALVAALQASGVDLSSLVPATPATPSRKRSASTPAGEAWIVRGSWKGQEIRGGMLYTARKLGLTIPANADRYSCSKLIGAALVKSGTPYGKDNVVYSRIDEV